MSALSEASEDTGLSVETATESDEFGALVRALLATPGLARDRDDDGGNRAENARGVRRRNIYATSLDQTEVRSQEPIPPEPEHHADKNVNIFKFKPSMMRLFRQRNAALAFGYAAALYESGTAGCQALALQEELDRHAGSSLNENLLGSNLIATGQGTE